MNNFPDEYFKLNTSLSSGHKQIIKSSDIIKPEFLKKTFYFESRTDRMKFVLTIFNRETKIDKFSARKIRRWLNSQKFTRAECHAILFNLGFRYKYVSSSYDHNIRNLQVNGYIIPKTGRGKLKFTSDTPMGLDGDKPIQEIEYENIKGEDK